MEALADSSCQPVDWWLSVSVGERALLNVVCWLDGQTDEQFVNVLGHGL